MITLKDIDDVQFAFWNVDLTGENLRNYLEENLDKYITLMVQENIKYINSSLV